MSLYKIAKSLNQIREERAHRNRRVKAAPYIAGGAAAAALMIHDTTKPTGAVQMKFKGGKLVRGTQRQYHLLREGGAKAIGRHLESSAKRAIPRAAAIGGATALAGQAYKYLAEEKAHREEKARRRQLRR